jgi:hypothetical protein
VIRLRRNAASRIVLVEVRNRVQGIDVNLKIRNGLGLGTENLRYVHRSCLGGLRRSGC